MSNDQTGVPVTVIPIIRLPRHVRQRYTYMANESYKPGHIVSVLFRGTHRHAVTVEPETNPVGVALKPLQGVTSYGPLTLVQQTLLKALGEHYGAPDSLAALTIAGGLAKRDNAIVTPRSKRFRQKHKVTPEERELYASGSLMLSGASYSPLHPLIQGMIGDTYSQGKQILCLFPDAYSAVYANAILSKTFTTLLVASDTPGEKTRQWKTAQQTHPLVVCGTRSALFFPYSNLGRIIIFNADDEGHRSWDQEPHYDVRALAELIAKHHRVSVVNTSPLPLLSIPTTAKLHLNERAFSAKPRVEDIRHRSIQTTALTEDMVKEISSAPQARYLFYTNRVGSGLLSCVECRELLSCPHCSHPFRAQDPQSADAQCQRCRLPSNTLRCRHCGSLAFRPLGTSTERIGKLIAALLPHTNIVRIDSSAAKTPTDLSRLLTSIREKPGVVVASSAILPRLWSLPSFDQSFIIKPELDLSVPSWQANEDAANAVLRIWAHTRFQMWIATAAPEHITIRALTRKKIRDFIKTELEFRKRFHYPPYQTVLAITPKRGQKIETQEREALKRTWPGAALTQSGAITLKLPEQELVSFWSRIPSTWKVDINPRIVP